MISTGLGSFEPSALLRPLRIKSLHARVVAHSIAKKRVIRSAAGIHDQSIYLEVTLRDADGCCGYGEAATTACWSGETAASAWLLFEEVLVPVLKGLVFDHPGALYDSMDAVLRGNPFLKSAVDTAAWDLFARRESIPAWKLFADREPETRLPTRVSIGANPVDETVALAKEYQAMGLRMLKFKVGSGGFDDALRLQAARDAVGWEIPFLVDYNGAFDCAQAAARHIESLLPWRITAFEQPTSRGRISLLAETRRLTGQPILADEAVFTPDELEEALDLDAFDILSVYPGKNGGVTRTLAMARRAREAGKPCVMGSNLETDLGLAAMVSLAAACSAFPVWELPSDLANLYYESSSAAPPIRMEEGCVLLPPGPGFGVTPRDQ